MAWLVTFVAGVVVGAAAVGAWVVVECLKGDAAD
jgi:hypothetical protein